MFGTFLDEVASPLMCMVRAEIRQSPFLHESRLSEVALVEEISVAIDVSNMRQANVLTRKPYGCGPTQELRRSRTLHNIGNVPALGADFYKPERAGMSVLLKMVNWDGSSFSSLTLGGVH